MNLGEDGELTNHNSRLVSNFKSPTIPVAYYNPNRPLAIDDINSLRSNIVPAKSIGREHEVRKLLHEDVAQTTMMSVPVQRMSRIEESKIPINKIYNKVIDDAKKRHEAKNQYLRGLWQSEKPPESMQICYMKDFFHYDKAKGRFIDENMPETKTSKKYTLANIIVFKWAISSLTERLLAVKSAEDTERTS